MGVFKKFLNGPEASPDEDEPTQKPSQFYLALAAEEDELEQRSGFATAQAAIDRAIEEHKRQKSGAEAPAPAQSPLFGPPPLIERRTGAPDGRPNGSPDRRRLGQPAPLPARTFGKRAT